MDIPLCRICRDEEGVLISPCDCKGSVQHVHKECALKEIEVLETTRCSVCKAEYPFKRPFKLSLAHVSLLMSITLLIELLINSVMRNPFQDGVSYFIFTVHLWIIYLLLYFYMYL